MTFQKTFPVIEHLAETCAFWAGIHLRVGAPDLAEPWGFQKWCKKAVLGRFTEPGDALAILSIEPTYVTCSASLAVGQGSTKTRTTTKEGV